MMRILSKEESDLIESENNKFVVELDSNIKGNLKQIFEPLMKQINCFHTWIDPRSYENNLPKTKIYCIHCRLEKDIDYEEYVNWLDEATNFATENLNFNNRYDKRPANKQSLLNSLAENQDALILFKNKISAEDFAKYSVFYSWEKCSSSDDEIKKKIDEFKDSITQEFLDKIESLIGKPINKWDIFSQ